MFRKLDLPRVPHIITLSGLMLLLGYQNCSRVEFAKDLVMQKEKINAGGLVLINNNDPYTTETDVQLTLANNNADEMYLTNDPTCETGGEWEAFATIKAWKLSAKNTDVKVYAKFRESGVPDVHSLCMDDSIVHDDVAPTIDVTKGVADFINTKETTIEFAAHDSGSGVQVSSCQNDSDAGVSCDNKVNRSNMPEGSHSVSISTRDKAGNRSAPVNVRFAVDLTAPSISFTGVPSKMSAYAHAEFEYAATDALSGVKGYQCKKSAAADWQNCGSKIGMDYAEGPQKFTVRAIDNAGNLSAELAYDWTIDLTIPTVKITKGPGPFSHIVKPVFEFEGIDGTSPITQFECMVDTMAAVACTSPYTTPELAAGPHKFQVVGVDKFGSKSAPAVYNWLIDLTDPKVTIVSGPTPATNSVIATIVFTATDMESGISKIECQLDGGGYAPCTSPKNYPALAEGPHKFEVRATDKADNMSAVAVHLWSIDTTLPTIEIVSAPAPIANVTIGEFVLKATDPNGGKIARIECKIDAMTAYETCTSPKIYTALAEGAHIFSTRAVDEAGNLSIVKTHSWSIDQTAPGINFAVVPLSVIGVNDLAAIQFTVTDSSSGVDKVMCGLNGNLLPCAEAETKSMSYLPIGSYKFTVTATDKIGNQATKDITWQVVDNAYLVSQITTVRKINKFDVLVVIDNSGSMKTEQENMAARFGTFLDLLNGLDWQVAIVTTDVSKDKNLADGRMLLMDSTTKTYILNSTMDLAKAKTWFAATIQRPASEGSGDEQGIAATYRAIQRSQTPTNTINTPNVAFFRSDAALAVLIVTDANETPSGGSQVYNTPEGLVDLVRTTWQGKKTFSFNSIVVKSGDSVCRSSNQNEGYGVSYETLSQLTGGLIGTVCATDYGTQLTGMAQGTVDLQKSVTLNCLPQDTNADGKPDITVKTADLSPAPPYTVSGLKVTFEAVLPLGDNELTYTCLRPLPPN